VVKEKSYFAANEDVQVANPAEVQYPRDEGVVLIHKVPRASGLESLSSRTFPGERQVWGGGHSSPPLGTENWELVVPLSPVLRPINFNH
jgi:hypothetical protein